jgi:hypothetical protein
MSEASRKTRLAIASGSPEDVDTILRYEGLRCHLADVPPEAVKELQIDIIPEYSASESEATANTHNQLRYRVEFIRELAPLRLDPEDP